MPRRSYTHSKIEISKAAHKLLRLLALRDQRPMVKELEWLVLKEVREDEKLMRELRTQEAQDEIFSISPLAARSFGRAASGVE